MDIMLVDDSRVMRQLVRRTLRQAGYTVGELYEAEHGQDAIAQLKRCKPDLILSDWNMPTMNGIDMLVALRAAGNLTPLAFVTSESTPDMRARAAAAGALFVLTKPFTPESLREALTVAGLQSSAGDEGTQRAELVTTTFGDKLLSDILTRLINVPVAVKPGPKVVPAVTPCVAASWIDDDNEMMYAGFCELSVAASMGAALGLRPASAIAEMLRKRELPDALQADTREVFNVLSRTFNDCGSIHVRLSEITFPPQPALAAARKLDARPAARLDYQVQIQGYGMGKLSFVSTAPEFLLTKVMAERQKKGKV